MMCVFMSKPIVVTAKSHVKFPNMCNTAFIIKYYFELRYTAFAGVFTLIKMVKVICVVM